MGERESGNPQEGGRKRAFPRRSHEEQYVDLTCHIISVHKTIKKKFKCNKCPYISAYTGSCKKIPACLNFPALFLPTDLRSQCTAHQP